MENMIEQNSAVIYEIIIPNYPSKIKLSDKQRAKYFEKKDIGKKIPKKYQNDRYAFNKDGILIDIVTGDKVIANSKSFGTPKLWNVNFQAIWSQAIKYQARNTIALALKSIFKPYLKNLKPIDVYPIRFELFIFDIDMVVDISNKGVIYTKIIEDLLTELGVIIDDKAEYVNDTGRCKWIKVNDQKDVKMIIRISKSNNNYE